MIIEERLETEVRGEYDVIVVGAGPAGSGAALAAARCGLKVLMIERCNALGGMWTTGFMNPVFDFEDKTGLMAELIRELSAEGEWGGYRNQSFGYEYMKALLDRKFAEAGVDILFNTVFARAVCEGDRVKGVIVENCGGRSAYLAKYVIDASGDGAVAADAGCEFQIGDDETGDYRNCQAMTLMYLVGNIPDAFTGGAQLGPILDRAYEARGKQAPYHSTSLITAPNSHFGIINLSHLYEYDPLDPAALSRAMIEGRRQIMESFEELRRTAPEFAGLELITSSATIGIRESRRICGEYTVTEEDLMNGSRFADAVVRVSFNVDIHPKGSHQVECRKVKPYDVPLRSLIPRGKSGLLVAGRCISGSHVAEASYRATADCLTMGENGGFALAYALKKGCDIREVRDTEAVRRFLGLPSE